MPTAIAATKQSARNSWVIRHWVTLTTVFVGLVVALVLAGSYGYEVTFKGKLFIIGALILLRHFVALLWWMRQRRRVLAAASEASPGLFGLLRERNAEALRVRRIRAQWGAFCDVQNFRGRGKMVPTPHHFRSTAAGDITFLTNPGDLAVKGGVERLIALAPELRKVIGQGCKEVLVRYTNNDQAFVTALWSAPLERPFPVSELPAVEDDRLAYSIDHERSALSIVMSLAVIIIGLTGSGKSGILWVLLFDMMRKVKHVLYVADPKGGQELGVLKPLVGHTHGNRTVEEWVGSAEGAARIVDSLYKALKDRQAALMGQRKWTQSMADEYPLLVGVFDEGLNIMSALKPPDLKKLYTILSEGRAAGVTMIILAQLPQKEVLQQARNLIAQRLGLQTESPLDTGLIFGDSGAEEKGARCSDIRSPGLGYARMEGVRGYVPFRAPYVTDAEIAAYVEGELPEGMATAGGVVETYFNYRFYTADMQPLRTGITNNFERRYAEYRAAYAKEQRQIEAGELEPAAALHGWFPFHDPKRTRVTEAGSKAEAKRIESEWIDTGVWRGNHQENMGSSLRNVPPVVEPKHHWWDRKPRPADDAGLDIITDPEPVEPDTTPPPLPHLELVSEPDPAPIARGRTQAARVIPGQTTPTRTRKRAS